MKRKIFIKLSSILLCICLLAAELVVFATEEEFELPSYSKSFESSAEEIMSLSSLLPEKNIKEDIKAAIKARQNTVDLRKYAINVSELQNVYNLFFDVLCENPQFFYINSKASAKGIGSIIAGLDLSNSYAYTDEETINKNQALIDIEVNRILKTIDSDMSDAEKALAVHDWFDLRYSYNLDALQLNGASSAHRIDGLFIEKTAVCQGYALGYIYVLSKLGIEAIYVSSEAMRHAWNMVKLGDNWYHVDVTYDDPIINGKDKLGFVSHSCFLRSDAGIMGSDPENPTHFAWKSKHTAVADYPNMFWKDITSGIFYIDGKWYYKKGNNIVSQKFTDSSTETIHTVTDRWPGTVGYYTGLFGIGVYNGRIYYNTATEIHNITTSGKDKRIQGVQDLGQNQIYGIVVFDDMFYLATGTNPNEKHTIKTIQMSKENIYATKKEGKITVYFPQEPVSEGYCFVAWYNGDEFAAVKVNHFNKETVYISVLDDVKEATEIKIFMWDKGLSPLYKSITLQ